MPMPKSDKKRPVVLEVWLNQIRVGTITNLPYDQNLFVFDEEYARAGDRPVLSLSFYDDNRELITEPEQVQTKVSPFFSNLLPEGRLREYLPEAAGIKDVREFFLLWLLGADLPGAVIVQESEGTPLPPADADMQKTSEPRKEQILRFSLAGVQLKFSAIGNPGKQLTIPAEGRGGAWIIKLPSARFPLVPENEFSMMKLAGAVGIAVPEVGLMPTNQIQGLPFEFSDANANSLYVRRFDRTPDGGRIHIEDFNQIYHQFPHDKYKHYSYTNMARDISNFLGTEATVEFIRRLVFNAAIGNADMHLKNWSVLYPDTRTPQLAPGYDFVSTIACTKDRKMALSIAKEKDTKRLDQSLLERFAEKAGLPKHMVVQTALDTAEKTVRAWSEMASDLPLHDQVREGIEEQLRYLPLTQQLLDASGKNHPKKVPTGEKIPRIRKPRH
jgi:serine/threonine-protein kinase HipA